MHCATKSGFQVNIISTNYFSLIITLYSGTDNTQVTRCLESINNQTLLPSELIIVFDGKVPSSLDKCVFEYCDSLLIPDIKYVSLIENSGPGVARNIGFDLVSYDTFAIMDSDDECFVDRFELQMKYILDGFDFVGGQIVEIANSGHHIIKTVPETNKEIHSLMSHGNCFNNVTFMARSKAFAKTGGYANLRYGEDYVLWLRAIKYNLSFYNVQKPLVKVYVDNDFFGRRTGVKVFIREYKYINLLLKEQHITLFVFFKKVFRACLLRFLPTFIVKKIYSTFRGN